MTIWGQPAEYWAGQYDAAFEANPIVRFFMVIHPAAFHALTVVWIAAFCVAIVKLPPVLARMTSLCITFSHAFCAGTWLYMEPDGFVMSLVICIATGIIYVGADEMSRVDVTR